MSEKTVEEMTFQEINQWAAGELILSIGEGKFRSQLSFILLAVSQAAYNRGMKATEKKAD